jgi:predicted PurR-regulated permease PerM
MPNWIRWAGKGVLVVLGLYFAWRLLDVLVLLAIALLIATALWPVVRWLNAHGIPRLFAILFCILGLIGIIGGIVAYLVPVVISQIVQLANLLSSLAHRFSKIEESWALWRSEYAFLPRFSEIIQLLQNIIRTLSLQAVAFTRKIILLTVEILTVLFFVLFFLKDGPILLAGVLRLAPKSRREEVLSLIQLVGYRVGRYVISRLLIMAFIGILTGIGLTLIGVSYPLLLGALAGLLDIVPYIGPIIAAIPGIILGLSQSWQLAVWVVVIYIAVQQFESLVISPLLVGKIIDMHPVWVMLAVMIGVSLMGITGMILAVPAASTLQIVINELDSRKHSTESS